MKRSFSLIEMLIVLTLVGLLSGSLFFWSLKLTSDAKQKKEEALTRELQLLDLKLTRLFTNIGSDYFFTDDQGLVFYYDNGIQKTPLFSSFVLVKLYYNEETRSLEMSMWPSVEKGKEPSLQFSLMQDLDQIEFSFYSPTKAPLTVAPEFIGDLFPDQGWRPTWKRHYQNLPTFVKITLHQEKHSFCFAYQLLEGEKPLSWLCN